MDEQDYLKTLTETEARSKSNTKRINELKEKQEELNDLVASVKVIANEQGHIKGDVAEIKTGIKALAEKPAKRWDGVVDKVISVVIGIVVAFIFTQIGM